MDSNTRLWGKPPKGRKVSMRRQLTGLVLVLFGLLALGFGATIGPVPTPAGAMPALQPSARPPLAPTSDGGGGGGHSPGPIAKGRITGTVIDIRTGAPAPGKHVVVGTFAVTSDGNGNYDLWLDPGKYLVSLSLSTGEGTAAQAPTLATVWGNDVVVVHLFFTSLAPLPTATALAVAPAVPFPTAMPLPTPMPPSVVLPGDLPNSSVGVGQPVKLPLTSVAAQPTSLPVTGNELLDPQNIILGGLALFALGTALMLLPRRAPARVGVSAPRPRRRMSAQEFLAELLRRDP